MSFKRNLKTVSCDMEILHGCSFLINRKAWRVVATWLNLAWRVSGNVRPSSTTKIPSAMNITDGERHRMDCFMTNEVKHACVTVFCCLLLVSERRTFFGNSGKRLEQWPPSPAMWGGRPRLLRHARPQRCQKCEGLMRAPGRGTWRRTMQRYSPCVNTLLNVCVLFVLGLLFFSFFALTSCSSCLIHAALQKACFLTLKGRFKNKYEAGNTLNSPGRFTRISPVEKKKWFHSFVFTSPAKMWRVMF